MSSVSFKLSDVYMITSYPVQTLWKRTLEHARVGDATVCEVCVSSSEHDRIDFLQDRILTETEVAVCIQRTDVSTDLDWKTVSHDGSIVKEGNLGRSPAHFQYTSVTLTEKESSQIKNHDIGDDDVIFIRALPLKYPRR